MKPNNVTRLLDARGITYTAYELPEEKLGAEDAARLLGAPLEQVFKTIVVTRQGKGKSILAVVPGTREVNLKLLAKVLGEKKVNLPTEREAERITGLQAGGISPLALLNRGFQVVIDSSDESLDQVYISGGRRGLNIQISLNDLISLTHASRAFISS